MSTTAMGADRAMPSVNQKKRGGNGFLGIAVVVFLLVGSMAGASWFAVSKLKGKDAQTKKSEVQEEPPISKPRKLGDSNATPSSAPGQDVPAPQGEYQVGQIGSAEPIGVKKPGLRQPGSPQVQAPADQELKGLALRSDTPSPYDSGFIVTGTSSKGGGGGGIGTAAGAQTASAIVSNLIAAAPSGTAPNSGGDSGGANSNKGALGTALSASSYMPSVRAARISNRSLMASKGTSAECVLRTRIVVAQPGLVLCRLASPIYSSNGKVVLADRGSTVTGEISGSMKTGQNRIFIIWQQIETPEGVTIRIDSPAADQLGGAGIDGDVDNRWGERIGAALMVSVISDAIAYQTAKDAASNSTGTAVYQNTSQTGKGIAEKVLESTINIPPILFRNQGDKILIMIGRDLDFSSVYDLEAKQ